METKDLIKHAIERKFTEFDAKTKEILSVKVAQKLAEKGYFKRLDQAKGIFEDNSNQEEN